MNLFVTDGILGHHLSASSSAMTSGWKSFHLSTHLETLQRKISKKTLRNFVGCCMKKTSQRAGWSWSSFKKGDRVWALGPVDPARNRRSLGFGGKSRRVFNPSKPDLNIRPKSWIGLDVTWWDIDQHSFMKSWTCYHLDKGGVGWLIIRAGEMAIFCENRATYCAHPCSCIQGVQQ